MKLNVVNSIIAKGDQAKEIVVMTESSFVSIEEVNIWRTVQEEDLVV